MEKRISFMLFVISVMLIGTATVQAAEIAVQPKILAAPGQPATPVPGKNFTFYVPVKFSNIHPDVARINITCLVTAKVLGGTGGIVTISGGSEASTSIPITDGNYTSTVTIAYNKTPGVGYDIDQYNQLEYRCFVSAIVNKNGEWKSAQILSQGTPPTWYSYKTGTLQVNGPLP